MVIFKHCVYIPRVVSDKLNWLSELNSNSWTKWAKVAYFVVNLNHQKRGSKISKLTTLKYIHAIMKVKFLSNFHEFFIQNFLTIFLLKSKLCSKVQKHNIFTSFSPKKIDNFLGKSKLNFWTKNEDFEQCVYKEIGKKSLGPSGLD